MIKKTNILLLLFIGMTIATTSLNAARGTKRTAGDELPATKRGKHNTPTTHGPVPTALSGTVKAFVKKTSQTPVATATTSNTCITPEYADPNAAILRYVTQRERFKKTIADLTQEKEQLAADNKKLTAENENLSAALLRHVATQNKLKETIAALNKQIAHRDAHA